MPRRPCVALACVLAFALPSGAAALDPAACLSEWQREEYGTMPPAAIPPVPDEVGPVRLRSRTGPALDLGGGLVATGHLIETGAGGEEGWVVEHCESGRSFVVYTRLWEGGAERRLRDDPLEVVRAAVASERPEALDEVAGRFGPIALVLPADGEEGCACAAFYPALRGGKAPY